MSTKTTLAGMTALGLVLALAGGCGSSNGTAHTADQSLADARNAEIEAERQEFVEEKTAKLDELDKEIGLLETKLKHESKFVDNEQRAEWSQELFELKQERNRLTAEIDRANTATEEEWKEMRGDFGVAIDTLEAGVIKLRDTVTAAFNSEPGDSDEDETPPEEIKMVTHGGLCPVDLADAKVDIAKKGGVLVVTITTTDPAKVKELRARAKKLVDGGEYLPAADTKSDEEPGDAEGMAVQARFENVPAGVRIILAPKDKANLDALQQHLENDMKALGTGRCASEPSTS